MGSTISSTEYLNKVIKMSDRVVSGPPKLVKLNYKQKTLAKDFSSKLNKTCKVCECMRKYAYAISPKVPNIDMALPDDDSLCFNKHDILHDSIYQIKSITTYTDIYGFLPHIGIAYLGRLLVAMKLTIDEDLLHHKIPIEKFSQNILTPESNKSTKENEKLLQCKKAIDESMSSLEKLCDEFTSKQKNDSRIVWITEDSSMVYQWKPIMDENKN